MVRRFTIALAQEAVDRLIDLARAEWRDPRDEAALLLERVLARRLGRSSGRAGPVEPGR